MAELTVLLVRHAESLGNLSGQFQGQTDTPLSSKGRRQAERLAARLADQPIQAVYTSDMSRAHETARPIAERTGAPLIAKQELREIDVGKMVRPDVRGDHLPLSRGSSSLARGRSAFSARRRRELR